MPIITTCQLSPQACFEPNQMVPGMLLAPYDQMTGSHVTSQPNDIGPLGNLFADFSNNVGLYQFQHSIVAA
jgi:hypothetical protein